MFLRVTKNFPGQTTCLQIRQYSNYGTLRDLLQDDNTNTINLSVNGNSVYDLYFMIPGQQRNQTTPTPRNQK